MTNDDSFRIHIPEQLAKADDREALIKVEKFRMREIIDKLCDGDVAIIVSLQGGDIHVQSFGSDDNARLLGVYALGSILINGDVHKQLTAGPDAP